jgi:hypothetical protein
MWKLTLGYGIKLLIVFNIGIPLRPLPAQHVDASQLYIHNMMTPICWLCLVTGGSWWVTKSRWPFLVTSQLLQVTTSSITALIEAQILWIKKKVQR